MRHRSLWCDVGPILKLIDLKPFTSDKGITYSRNYLRRTVKTKEFPTPISVMTTELAGTSAGLPVATADAMRQASTARNPRQTHPQCPPPARQSRSPRPDARWRQRRLEYSTAAPPRAR